MRHLARRVAEVDDQTYGRTEVWLVGRASIQQQEDDPSHDGGGTGGHQRNPGDLGLP